MKYSEALELVKGIEEFVHEDGGDYIDFDKYEIEHNPDSPIHVRVYTGWKFTMHFGFDGDHEEETVLTGCYYSIGVNSPYCGWDCVDEVPYDHYKECVIRVNDFCRKLVSLGFPEDIIFDAYNETPKFEEVQS